jgi:hypothetical protein
MLLSVAMYVTKYLPMLPYFAQCRLSSPYVAMYVTKYLPMLPNVAIGHPMLLSVAMYYVTKYLPMLPNVAIGHPMLLSVAMYMLPNTSQCCRILPNIA